jgi:hypothetical protein
MIPQDDEMAAIDAQMQYNLSTLEKEFGSRNNETRVQCQMCIPGNCRHSDRLHYYHALQGREFVRHKHQCKVSKSVTDGSTFVRIERK